MGQVRRIALLMNLDLGFSRAVIRGVREYGLQRPGWTFRSGRTTLEVIPDLRRWQPHGIVSSLYDEEFARRVKRLRKPVVDTRSCIGGAHVPVVDVDHAAVGRMAAEYFLSRGFAHFGYFGVRAVLYSRVREESFRSRLEAEDHTVSSCYAEYFYQAPATTSWKALDRQTRAWLKALPKPAAVFACNDIRARTLADTCALLGLEPFQGDRHIFRPSRRVPNACDAGRTMSQSPGGEGVEFEKRERHLF